MFTTKYYQLSLRDKRALLKLARALDIPLFPRENTKTIEKHLLEGTSFFNDEPCLKYKNGLMFHTDMNVSEILHEIGHVLFMGKKVWDMLEPGTPDFGDARWKGEEEGPVMFLQVAMADCLKDYGGSRRCFEEMQNIGYAFGVGVDAYNDTDKWYMKDRFKEYKVAQKLRVYNGFSVK